TVTGWSQMLTSSPVKVVGSERVRGGTAAQSTCAKEMTHASPSHAKVATTSGSTYVSQSGAAGSQALVKTPAKSTDPPPSEASVSDASVPEPPVSVAGAAAAPCA